MFSSDIHLTSLISIHAPRVGSDAGEELAETVIYISIHAPRVGSDSMILPSCISVFVSIHAPRVGSDSKIAQFFACNFAQK